MHPLLTKLKDQFPDAVLGVREEGPYQDLVAQVEPAAVPEVARTSSRWTIRKTRTGSR